MTRFPDYFQLARGGFVSTHKYEQSHIVRMRTLNIDMTSVALLLTRLELAAIVEDGFNTTVETDEPSLDCKIIFVPRINKETNKKSPWSNTSRNQSKRSGGPRVPARPWGLGAWVERPAKPAAAASPTAASRANWRAGRPADGLDRAGQPARGGQLPSWLDRLPIQFLDMS